MITLYVSGNTILYPHNTRKGSNDLIHVLQYQEIHDGTVESVGIIFRQHTFGTHMMLYNTRNRKIWL